MPRAVQARPNAIEHPLDEGCEFSPRCVDCVLPRCRHDLPPKVAKTLYHVIRLHELEARGCTLNECASALGLSRRQTFRVRQNAERYAALLEVEA